MRRVFTIGYEGASLEDFIATLLVTKVDVLLDVRELATSRRRGFSKTALSNALTDAGIRYQHEKLLGSPSDIRHRLRDDGDYKSYFRDFRRYLKTQNELLDLLAEDIPGNVALMCYERDPSTCHRSVVAEAFEERIKVQPKHLGVKHDVAKQKPNAPRAYPGQGVSAA